MAFINVKFPLEDSTQDNFFFKRNKTTIEAIKSNILLLLTTEKGERFYRRDFGTNLQKFLFEPNSEISEFDIEEDLKSTISSFIPQVKVQNINFIKPSDDENQLILDIQFTYSDANAVFSESISLRIN